MDYLQNILDNTSLPYATAFILGLMSAISPCPLATNITAIAYISRNIDNKKRVFINGLIYTLGRGITYFTIALILFLGVSKFAVANFLQSNGEKFLGPILVFIGIFMLDLIKINLPSFGKISEFFQNKLNTLDWFSSLMMGILFALAFCPYSGVLYFGMLIPMTIAEPQGLYLPLIFALATGLPVVIFAYIISFTIANVGNLFNKIKTFEYWFRKIVGIVFILVGLYYLNIFFNN